MSEVTNEQKLYVLLDCLYEKTLLEKYVWRIVSRNMSKSYSWWTPANKELQRDNYIDYGVAVGKDGKPRQVWSTNSLGEKQIPILLRGTRFEKNIFSKLLSYVFAAICALVAAVITAFGEDLYKFIKETIQ